MDKKSLRAWAKEFDKSKCSKELIELLKKSAEYQNAKNIMIFYPLKKEVNLLPLLEDEVRIFSYQKSTGKIFCAALTKKRTNFAARASKLLNRRLKQLIKTALI